MTFALPNSVPSWLPISPPSPVAPQCLTEAAKKRAQKQKETEQ